MMLLKIYVVKSGDSLYSIAKQFGITADDIAYANQLKVPSIISIGQSLIIPTSHIIHTVKRGQTVESIARSYGVSTVDILDRNPQLGNGNLIYPGQVLKLPLKSENLGEIITEGYVVNASERALKSTLPYMTFLTPFSYYTDSLGELTQKFDVDLSLSAEAHTANLLSITNQRPSGGFSSEIAHTVLTNKAAQDNLMDNILTLLQSGNWYGISIDFEYIYQFDKDSYNQFVKRVADTLHPLGYIVVTLLAPKMSDRHSGIAYTAHDYAFHGATADYVVLMTYDWGHIDGPAMPISPINMVRKVLDYAVTVIPSGKILMGMPNYGYNWKLPFVQGTSARLITNVGAVTLAGSTGTNIQYDTVAQAPYFRFYDSEGVEHEVWFEDPRSIKAKLELVYEYELAGVSYWNLDSFYRPNFLILQSMYSVQKMV